MDDDDDDDDDGRTYKVRALELARVCVCACLLLSIFSLAVVHELTDDELRCFKYKPWPTTRVVLAMATAIR